MVRRYLEATRLSDGHTGDKSINRNALPRGLYGGATEASGKQVTGVSKSTLEEKTNVGCIEKTGRSRKMNPQIKI